MHADGSWGSGEVSTQSLKRDTIERGATNEQETTRNDALAHSTGADTSADALSARPDTMDPASGWHRRRASSVVQLPMTNSCVSEYQLPPTACPGAAGGDGGADGRGGGRGRGGGA